MYLEDLLSIDGEVSSLLGANNMLNAASGRLATAAENASCRIMA